MKEETPYLLLLETATEVCSVAVARGNELIALQESHKGHSHATHLIPFADAAIREAGIDKQMLSGVALSIGPGSYTGLRIGASAAKGLCYALDIPLVTLSTLQNIVMGAKKQCEGEGINYDFPFWYCPMIDARRMEVYTAFFDGNGEMMEEVKAQIVDEHTFKELLREKRIVFCGNGMMKCREVIGDHPHAVYMEAPLSAQNMIEKACEKFERKEWEDVAYFEPFYLKEYIAVKSRVKGLE